MNIGDTVQRKKDGLMYKYLGGDDKSPQSYELIQDKPVQESKPGYVGGIIKAVTEPVKGYIGDVKSAMETPVVPQYFPGMPQRDPTKMEFATALGSRAAGLAAGIPLRLGEMGLGVVNAAFGGYPGKALQAGVGGAGELIKKNPLTPAFEDIGSGIAQTQFGKDIYGMAQNPTVRANIGGALKAAAIGTPELMALRESKALTGAAEKLGEKVPALKPLMEKATTQTIIKSQARENLDNLINRLPKAYKEKLPANLTEQQSFVGNVLDKYDLRKYLSQEAPDAGALEVRSRALFESAVKKADDQLEKDLGGGVVGAKPGQVTIIRPKGGGDAIVVPGQSSVKFPEEINPIDLYRKAIDKEISKDQSGLFAGLSGDARLTKAQKFQQIMSAYDHPMDYKELLEFKRKVLNPSSSPIYDKSIGLNDNEKIDILLRKATNNELIKTLKDKSPEAWKLNQEANHLASIAEAAHGLKLKSVAKKAPSAPPTMIGTTLGGLAGASALAGDPLLGALAGGTMGTALGSTVRSFKNIGGDVLQAAPNYRLSLLGRGWGKPMSERAAAPNIRNLKEPVIPYKRPSISRRNK